MKPIHYYFTEKCFKEAFQECYSAIFAELNTENAHNLSKNVNIEEILDEEDQNSEYYTEFLEDCDILIDSPLTLKKQVEFLIDEYHIDIANIYITEQYITKSLSSILIELEQQDREDIVKAFTISFVKHSNASTLFNVLFARNITLENVSIMRDEGEVENILQYDDYDYTPIFDKIHDYLMNADLTQFDFEFDQMGGDADSEHEDLDFYYIFTKKIEDPEEKKIFTGDIFSENCSSNSEEEGYAIALKMKEIFESRYPGSEINIILNTQGSNPNPISSEEDESETDYHISEAIYAEACEAITDNDLHHAKTLLHSHK